MISILRGLLSLAMFSAFGAGSVVMSVLALFLRGPERCHGPIRASWRATLWMFETLRLIKVDRGGIPDCRGCVLTANHPSLIDVVIIVALVPRTLFVAKHALAGNPFLSLIVGSASLPDDERLPEAARPYIEKGWNILVFPEGTRSPANGMLPFRRGAANVALRCGAPVVRVALRQSHRILGKDQKPWEMGGSRVVYSTVCSGPLAVSRNHGETMHAAAVRATSEIRAWYAPPRVSGKGVGGVAAVVPVFNPEPALRPLCEKLAGTFGAVVVVDDGSVKAQKDFDDLPAGVEVVRHARNRGKGAAMRTALMRLCGRVDGAVFMDGDGQHGFADSVRVAERMIESGKVALGVRDLSGKGVPRRSRIGNACMSFFLRLFCGGRVSDTQTGLRAVPERLFGRLLALSGDRFEYEMKMLAMLHLAGESVEEVPIDTIYPESGRVSHHRPLRDSVRIWFGLAGAAVSERFRR